VLLWAVGLIRAANALNLDSRLSLSYNSKIVARRNISQLLDTFDDLGGWGGWSADSQIMRGYLYYANSSSEIDIDILDLTNPEDFNSEAFDVADGIWYFPQQVLFEQSDDPIVLTAASFNYSEASFGMTNVYVRYYLHGDTSFKICTVVKCSHELYNNNELEEWQEILFNLNDIADEVEFDKNTAYLVSLLLIYMNHNIL